MSVPKVPVDWLATLREQGPRVLQPAFEQALMQTELAVQKMLDAPPPTAATPAPAAEAGAKEGEEAAKPQIPTFEDGQALQRGVSKATRVFRDEFEAAVVAAGHSVNRLAKSDGLSLVDDEQLASQLVFESVVGEIGNRHKRGIEVLDQRLASILKTGPLAARNPLGAMALVNAARSGLHAISLSPAACAMALRQFQDTVDTPLGVLLKDFSERMAKAGILPDLVVPELEERKRSTPAESKPAETKAVAAPTPPAAPAPVTAGDRALYDSLFGLMRGLQANRTATDGLPPLPPGGGMERALASTVVGMVQRELPGSLVKAVQQGGTALAPLVRQELAQSAQAMGLSAENARLSAADDSALELVAMMFEALLDVRPYSESVRPVMAKMLMPLVKAALLDKEVFLKREHPARKLMNTISEACEENAGVSAQDRELLGYVEKATERITEEFDEDFSTFESAEKELSDKLANHRRRIGIAEKRASETQRGQERLELARTRAAEAMQQAVANRDMPEDLGEFLNQHVQHHLVMVALKDSGDGEAWRAATDGLDDWRAALDQADAGKALPGEQLDRLRGHATAALASAGITGEAADKQFREVAQAVGSWRHGAAARKAGPPKPQAKPATPPPAAATAAVAAATGPAAPVPSSPPAQGAAPVATPTPMPSAPTQTAPQAAPSSPRSEPASPAAPVAVPAAPGAPAEFADYFDTAVVDYEPPGFDELAEVRNMAVNTWVQLTRKQKQKKDFQLAKLSWVSDISNKRMFVSRRGARVLVATPDELASLRRIGHLLILPGDAPVDQALLHVVDKLRQQLPAG